MLNRAEIIGHLGRDPEVKHTQSGRIVNMTVATSERWKDRNSGERKERTEWHRVVIFNDKLGEIAERYLRKGSKVYVAGALQTREWTAQDTTRRTTTEIVLSQFRGELVLLDGRERATGSEPSSGFDDSDIPF